MQKLVYFLCLLGLICACSSIDCPLNNSVYARYKLAGETKTLSDTLTVFTHRNSSGDTVLLNKLVEKDSFELPMSFSGTEDVLFFRFNDKEKKTYIDTIAVKKTNEPHFESVDCNAVFFHTIQEIMHTRHKIDSIVIQNNRVTNDNSKATFLIYIKSNS